jgi:hypothetical protein
MVMGRILSTASTAGFVLAMTTPTTSLSRGLPPRPIAADNLTGFASSSLPDCPGGKPGRKKIAWVVRAVIPENVDITKPPRAIRYEPNDPNGTDDQEDDDDDRFDASKDNVTDDPVYENNPFNIDLTPIINLQDKKNRLYVKIRIIMKDARFKFFQFNGSHVISFGDVVGKNMFCSDHLKPNKTGKSVAIFYVRLGTGAAFDASGSYNFGLEAKAAADTPTLILIDPKVKNSG